MKVAGVLAVAVTAFAMQVPSAGGGADAPRIVPWKIIGSIGLGMSRARVEYAYGYAGPRMIDAGAMLVSADAAYRRRGGWLWVGYARGLVAQVGTTSRVYRTPRGLGVGSRIPLGRCRRVRGRCQYRWNGFVYSAEPCCGWYRIFRVGGRPVRVWLVARLGTVTAVFMTDVKRYG